MNTTAPFHWGLLHPKYWGYWLGTVLMRLLILLPLSAQYRLGAAIGRLIQRLMGKRIQVARRNLELCLPELSDAEREALITKNFEETGMALFDTANAWWWSDARIQSHMTIVGKEHIEDAEQAGQGVILMAAHCLMLEPGARVFGQFKPGIGVYRPHNNPMMEYLQVKGRLRSNKGLIPKREVRQMVKALRAGEVVWYTQDQDAGRRGSVFAPFFGVPAATAAGASTLAKLGKARVLPFFVERKADHSGYHIEIGAPLEGFPSGDELADTTRCNEVTEGLVRRRPEQYMWLHRRFKTRPNPDDPKIY
ncbi:LpxL/LpxP family Kdo(2)-lipid IV(A) lauroyl/palmitoleoyl acyltransferase [Ferrimonas balearica]|uniref:LpxL/LpxP family Kdo(2)-lipid IV(A) lauroyl/palmitoleoyl acyltransferase n=1 Tax=Ferrimonas balearica TaxID=44012 RepID=UPI001C99BC92|nr:LpxL/LpxP family Kdo(2)-lipid IV(A) lauroyl/palmitoleoyl acyltransferase [Ferrimonas balearica]MBY5923022.1 LpxL/LpxP family Kdo(2)-lipid IV(A) lauroyl/palmitoleoyl acyltransferase [Ferrimonas balearica]MBY5997601.1 LpxL/LpxP family Kdo(2)-lipid IV(A) lauroyl/palmitoleoyl acyltransferase [Ferrimonas balearica]